MGSRPESRSEHPYMLRSRSRSQPSLGTRSHKPSLSPLKDIARSKKKSRFGETKASSFNHATRSPTKKSLSRARSSSRSRRRPQDFIILAEKFSPSKNSQKLDYMKKSSKKSTRNDSDSDLMHLKRRETTTNESSSNRLTRPAYSGVDSPPKQLRQRVRNTYEIERRQPSAHTLPDFRTADRERLFNIQNVNKFNAHAPEGVIYEGRSKIFRIKFREDIKAHLHRFGFFYTLVFLICVALFSIWSVGYNLQGAVEELRSRMSEYIAQSEENKISS